MGKYHRQVYFSQLLYIFLYQKVSNRGFSQYNTLVTRKSFFSKPIVNVGFISYHGWFEKKYVEDEMKQKKYAPP